MPYPFFATESRLRHVLVCGKTGTGKSTLLRAICRADAEAGRGFVVIDPHGDLAGDVLRDIPKRRKNDVVHFNAKDPSDCPGLNPLRSVSRDAAPLVVSNVIATMRRLWDPGLWGPRTEHILRHALLALTEVRGATIDDVRRMLTDDKHRGWVLKQVTDAHVLDFWVKEFPGYGRQFGSEVTAPILNKVGALVASPHVRAIVAKSRPRIDARKLIDRGAIVIASLPKGRIGEDATALLGGLLLGAFQQAALGRADREESERVPFFVLVDEVGTFAAAPLLSLVAEARKFAVGLVLATQSMAVLDQPVRVALLGNVGTLVSFRVGADDAELLEREFCHEYRAEHLMRLAVGEMVVRTGVGRPMAIQTAPP